MASVGIALTGGVMAFIGFLIMYSQLDEPIFFAYQGLILGAVFFGLGVVVMAIAALVDRGEKRSIYFCGHCKFASSTEAELYNHSVKEHNDELGYGRKEVKEVVEQKPKRNLRKSPVLKGTMIGIIAVFIIFGALFGFTYQSFVMSNDGMAPTINTYDLVRYVKTPFNEIQVNDIIIYSDSNESKTWIHKVTKIEDFPRTLISKSEISDTLHPVTEKQYIGKVDSITEGVGYYARILSPPINIILLIAVFIIPIAVMKIRARKRLKVENS